jgi:nitroreductase
MRLRTGARWSFGERQHSHIRIRKPIRRNPVSDFLKVLNERTSAEHFDSATPIPAPVIRELIAEACQAPSAFNLQNWRFIAVTNERIKERLRETTIAPNQERVASAPLIFLILGDLNAHKGLKGILDETVHAGLLRREVANIWLTMANGIYASDPRLARDEAIRSGSLAAMTLMLAAANRGYASCPVGFNSAQVMEILSISEHYVPVMMLAIGRPASGNYPRRPRLPVDQVLTFDTSPE